MMQIAQRNHRFAVLISALPVCLFFFLALSIPLKNVWCQRPQTLSLEDVKQLGFTQLGTSGIYQFDNLALEFSGVKVTSYFNYASGLNLNDVEAIHESTVEGNEGIVLQMRTNGTLSWHNLMSTKYLESDPTLANHFTDFTNESITAQLLANKFTKVEGHDGIYTRDLARTESHPKHILAVTAGEKLVALFSRLPELFTDATLVSVRKQALRDRDTHELTGEEELFLAFKNQIYTFEIGADKLSIRIISIDREFTRQEIKLFPLEEKTQDNGFIIGGVNTTETIRALNNINGASIADLEHCMRPGAMSDAGFLGKAESLLQVLADDNDFVLEKGMTHQELAYPLNYIEKLYRLNIIDELKSVLGIKIVFNNVPLFVMVEASRGTQGSPFQDGTGTNLDINVTNLSTGAEINYSPLVGFMIDRYGFYEGHGTSYREDPRDIIAVFGLDPYYSDWKANDPVARLVDDSNASEPIEIKTSEQLARMANLQRLGIPILSEGKYRIVANDLEMLLTLGSLASDKLDLSHAFEQTVVEPSSSAPTTISLAQLSSLPRAYQMLPAQYRSVVLDRISAVTLGHMSSWELSYWLKRSIKQDEDGEIARLILSKLQIDGGAMLNLVDALRDVVPQDNPQEAGNMLDMIDHNLPQLRTQWLAQFEAKKNFYKKFGIEFDSNMSLAELYALAPKLAQVNSEVSSSIEFAQRIGGLEEVNETDMVGLFFIITESADNLQYQLDPNQQDVLERLQVDPKFIPYAIEIGERNNTRLPSGAITSLFNGTASQAYQVDQYMRKLPSGMDLAARAAAGVVIEYETYRFRKTNLDLDLWIAALAKLQKISEESVLIEYVSQRNPDFRALLSSPYVHVKRNESMTSRPAEVSLRIEEIEKVPEVEETGEYGIKTNVRNLDCAGAIYKLNKYYITVQVGDKTSKANIRDTSVLLPN